MDLKKAVFVVSLFALTIALSLDSYSAVLINEILANGVIEPDSEWVELFNNESFDVNLTGFNISETSSKNLTLSAIIPANGFIMLVENFTLFNSTFSNVNKSGVKIIEYGETVPDFELSNTVGTVTLYNSSGKKIDSLEYKQSSSQENISVGRYPDGSSSIFNISTLTPGAKNDNQNPQLNKWLNPSRNNTNISGLASIVVNITDDTTQVNSSIINFNGTNFSMGKNGDLWTFLWNTSLNAHKLYNITVYFNDSYGKAASDTLLNILVNNSPRIEAFSPSSLAQTLAEGSTLNFNVNGSDPDDAITFSWYVDSVLNSTSPSNFSYMPSFSDNGTHIINATIKDSLSQASLRWVLTVTNVNIAPSLDSISSKAFTKGTNSSFNITASDLDNDVLTFSSNDSAISFSKINNSLAAVSWKPTNLDLGSNVINLTTSDGSLTDSEIVTLMVNATDNAAPNITTSAKATAIANEQYSYDVDAVDADNDTLLFSLKTNASGMSINSATGLIAFNPSSTGFFIVNVSASDLIMITNQSYFLSVIYGTRLKIDDIDIKIDGKSSSNIGNKTKIGKEAKPGSSIEFKVNVKNDFTKDESIDIEEIEVKATIEEIDNDDDLEEESNEFDLRPEGDKTVTLKFDIPINVDDGTFDVLIEAEGADENGGGHGQFYEIELEVEKEKHDLRLLTFDVNPLSSCNSRFNAYLQIINAGTEDEEGAVLEIKSSIGNLISQNISINAGTEENVYSDLVKFKIDKNFAGNYQLTANVYTTDGKLQDTKTKDIKVEECIREKSSQVALLASEAASRNIQSTKEQVQIPTIKISFDEDGGMLLVFSTLLFATFFIFVAIILFIKM